MSDWRIGNDMNMYLKGLEDGKDRNKQEIEKLQFKINKATEYIKNHQLVFKISNKKQISDWFDMFYRNLLKILGDNE